MRSEEEIRKKLKEVNQKMYKAGNNDDEEFAFFTGGMTYLQWVLNDKEAGE